MRKVQARFAVAGLILAVCLTGALATEAFFPKVADMPTFADLPPEGIPGGVWYDYKSVQTTVEAGLMVGTNKGFEPGGHITLAEVATLAARINEKTTGYAIPAPEEGAPWYAPGLAVMEHLGVSVGSDPLAKATRADFVRILSAVLPDEMLSAINAITTLPDTKDPDVLRFYNAGILTGKNAYGTFDGAGNLTRSEGAAMVARVIDPSLRKAFTPAYSPTTPAA